MGCSEAIARPGWFLEIRRPRAAVPVNPMESMGASEMQMQTTRSEAAEPATRLRLGAGARYERKNDDALRPALGRERELDLLVEMAHDLRSPLTSIIALAELIQS